MSESGWLADQFEHWRPHLASVAYGMLGSVTEAEDAVQQAWLRLGRSDADAIMDLRAWLTTVVGRICLDMLRARKAHRVDYVGSWLPEPLVVAPDVVVHFDLGPDREPQPTLVGARTVAGHVLQTAPRFVAYARPAMVNGAAGLVFGSREEPFAVLAFTVSGGRIAELDMVSDPAKLGHIAIQR
jgi:hypothetical protein